MTKAPLMVTLSGIRGIAGDSLTPAVVSKYVTAFCQLLFSHPLNSKERRYPQHIVIGTDSRTSRDWVQAVATATINSLGISVKTIGIVPTPTVQYTVQEGGFAGGVVITSSHNPSEWNGLKFVDSDGLFVTPVRTQLLIDIAEGKEIAPYPSPPQFDAFGKSTDLEYSALEAHIDGILNLPYISRFLSAEGRKTYHKRLNIICDSACGAGGPALRALLSRIHNISFSILNEEPSGIFPHNPEPVPANLGDLADAVRTKNAHLGIAVDPDVDRCVISGQSGILSEELTLAMAVDFALAHGVTTPCVVKNMSTSLYTDRACAFHGVEVRCSPVGEACVAAAMGKYGARLGGEGNGGVMLGDLHVGRDAPLAAALVICWYLWRLTEVRGDVEGDEMPIDELVRERFGSLRSQKMKVALPSGGAMAILEKAGNSCVEICGKAVSKLGVDRADGVKVADGENWWVHLRASNTEPILRVIYEGGCDCFDDLEMGVGRFLREIGLD